MEHTNVNTHDEVNQQDQTISHGDKAPADPSNTSHIGQPVEHGVISKKDGITEQSSEWKDIPEKESPGESLISNDADKYVKDPSPEENGE